MVDSTSCNRLAFGEKKVVRFDSAIKVTEAARKVLPSLADFEAKNPSRFRCVLSVVDINGLVLLANTCSQAFVKTNNARHSHLHIQLSGEGRFYVEGKTLMGRAGNSAVFLPEGCSYEHEFTDQSSVVARINQSRLEQIALAMMGGLENKKLLNSLKQPAHVWLRFGDITFDAVFRLLFSQIDCYSLHQHMLDASGLDDVFYRALITAIIPDVFERQIAPEGDWARDGRLDRVCDYVLANLNSSITLTDLERLANVSKRTLNSIFFKTLGLTPMGWVQEQRLLAARAMLNKPGQLSSIGEVLDGSGFANASAFSFQYKRRFGEMPSTTLARARKRIF